MADQPLPSPARSPRRRNPVERLLVWSLIGVLLLLLAVELQAKRGYDASRNNLQSAIQAGQSTNTPLTFDHVGDHLSGWCLCSAQPQGPLEVVTYRWPSCFKRYVLTLTYRVKGGNVYGLVSENAPPEAPPEAPPMPEGWTPDWLPPEHRAEAWERWKAEGKPGTPAAESAFSTEPLAEDGGAPAELRSRPALDVSAN